MANGSEKRVPKEEHFKVGDTAKVVTRRYTTCGYIGTVVRVNYRPVYWPEVTLYWPKGCSDRNEITFYHRDLERIEG